MPKSLYSLSESKMKRYIGYFREGKKLPNDPLNEKTLIFWLHRLKGAKVSSSVIAGITHDNIKIEIEEPSGHVQRVPLQQIIHADQIILYWLARNLYPLARSDKKELCDFRSPFTDIGVKPVSNNTYAPRIAELVRLAEYREQAEKNSIRSAIR